jgi:polyhydroxybutyrate depolymerase
MKTFLNTWTLAALLLGLTTLQPLRAQTAPSGTTVTGTIVSGGLTRDYRLYVPASYRAGTALPLLFNLHALNSNNLEQEAYGDFRSIADTANFLIVHPNGTVHPQLGIRYWNTTSATIGGTVDDTAFLSALLTDISSKYSVDANRVYSVGMSNGGFMSYELGCRLSTRIAAIASVGGSVDPAKLMSCAPTHPMPVLEIHGDADNTVRYEGGVAFGVFSTEAIPTVLAHWVQVNGCSPTAVVTTLPNVSTNDNSTVERSVWSGGRNGSVVTHYRIIGGGHTWPGTAFPQGGSGTTNMDINASVEAWRFLRRYRLNNLVALASRTALDPAPGFTLSPNPAGPDGQVLVQAGRTIHPAQVTLLDALGRRIPARTTAAANGGVQLDLSTQASGVYLLQVELDGRRYQQKLVR